VTLVGKGAAVVVICLVIFMMKSSYNTRIILGVGLIAGLFFFASNKKR